METQVLSASDPSAVRRAADILRHGGLVAFPTDTVYGLGADAFRGEIVSRLYAVKGRSTDKAIAILIGSPDELPKVAEQPPPHARRLAAKFWPGALTLVVHKRPEVPDEVSAGGTVGVRVPDHEVVRALLALTGPLAVTSANRSGRPSSVRPREVLEALGGHIDLVLDGGVCPGGVPSTVVDCTVTPVRILRAGPIAEQVLFSFLNEIT